MAVDFNYFLTIKKIVGSIKEEFLFCIVSELIKVYSHLLICPLLCPKVLTKRIHYYGKISGETDLTDFIDLVSCTG